MCGIVGAIRREGGVLEALLDGLRRLEYRGYDSAGVALVGPEGPRVLKRAGRLTELERALEAEGLADGPAGIGHTRWATHGAPDDRNAHPHLGGDGLALVHNGIVENHEELRATLEREGARFRSETDSEALAWRLGRELAATGEPLEALRRALAPVRGYYAIGALAQDGGEPVLLAARRGPPLCVGRGEGALYLASDTLALAGRAREVAYLEDGDVAVLSPEGVRILDAGGRPVERPWRPVAWSGDEADRGAFPHFMLKEIHEQPDVLVRTIDGRLDFEAADARLDEFGFSDEALAAISRIQVLACGTALHAGLVARYLIEGLAGVPVDVEFASEFRYRNAPLAPNTAALAISQSGETADTLAALRLARERGARAWAICNVPGSTLDREAEAVLPTRAGPEIGVASTKAFLAQLAAAVLLAVRLGRARGTLAPERARPLLEELRGLVAPLERLLSDEAVARTREVAERHRDAKGYLFLGRGIHYPIALEGALKLKEISYVHAEGYPAGEMKHGPIALIEPGMSVVVVSARGRVAEKVRANAEQVLARGGQVVAVGSDADTLALAGEGVAVPESSEWLAPLLEVVPLQLLAYFVAAAKGCDIDKPRNLAKSVTVE